MGKYSPLYSQVDPNPREAKVLQEHKHLGSLRMQEQERQQTYVCLQQVKRLNKHYSSKVREEGAQAERLAKMNYQCLKREAEELKEK